MQQLQRHYNFKDPAQTHEQQVSSTFLKRAAIWPSLRAKACGCVKWSAGVSALRCGMVSRRLRWRWARLGKQLGWQAVLTSGSAATL